MCTLACTFAGPQLLCSLGAPSSKVGSVVICKAAITQRWLSTSSQNLKSCWCTAPGLRQWRVRLLHCCIYRLHSPHCLELQDLDAPKTAVCPLLLLFCNVCGTTVIELHLQPLFSKLRWLKKGKKSSTVTRTSIISAN